MKKPDAIASGSKSSRLRIQIVSVGREKIPHRKEAIIVQKCPFRQRVSPVLSTAVIFASITGVGLMACERWISPIYSPTLTVAIALGIWLGTRYGGPHHFARTAQSIVVAVMILSTAVRFDAWWIIPGQIAALLGTTVWHMTTQLESPIVFQPFSKP